jgi:hypothetical protein
MSPIGGARAGLLSSADVGGVDIPDSGIARWTFDNSDTSGSTASDVWGSNDGTINGATTGVSGANQTYSTNEAYSFDGTDDDIDLGTGSTVKVTDANAYTVGAWVKSSAGSEAVIYGDYDGSGFFLVHNYTQSGVPEAQVRDDSPGNVARKVGSTAINDGNWHHVVAVIPADNSASGMKLYVDGSRELETIDATQVPNTFTNTQNTRIGARGDQSTYYGGDIDDVRLYDKELTSTEISDWYNNGAIA